jgi:phage terminase large subunit
MTSKHFAKHVLHLVMWKKLREIFDAIDSGKRKILIRSANGIGKTTALAALCNWKLATHKDSIVLTTASSHMQVRQNLWGEIRRQAKHANLYGDTPITQGKIKLDEKHYAIAISPREPENAQGFHARSMLIAIDEATGANRDVINALIGTATGNDVQIVMIYNPMTTDSFVYEAERSGDWHVITISANEHPNIIMGRNIIEGAITRRSYYDNVRAWSYEVDKTDDKAFFMMGKYYRRTAEITKRIFGEWAEDGGEGFIPMHLVRRSLTANIERGIKSLGVDVARGGEDETCFAFFDGGVQEKLITMRTRDMLSVAERVRKYYDEGWNIITIDDTGIGGGVTDILRSYGIEVNAIHFAQAAKGFFRRQRKQLANARAEMYFVLDDELKRGVIQLADDHLLHQELTSIGLRQNPTSEAYHLESKDDIKQRLGRSPDRADATALARYGLRLEAEKEKVKFM